MCMFDPIINSAPAISPMISHLMIEAAPFIDRAKTLFKPALAAIGVLSLSACEMPPEVQENEKREAGGPTLRAIGPSHGSMSIYQDSETGCHFYGSYSGGILKREDRNGAHICTDVKP